MILRQLYLSSVGSGARRTSPQTASRRHASLLAFVRRYAPSNAATRQPGLRPVRKTNVAAIYHAPHAPYSVAYFAKAPPSRFLTSLTLVANRVSLFLGKPARIDSFYPNKKIDHIIGHGLFF